MLQNLRKLLEESSLSLRDALGGRAYFRSVQVVVPSDWREAMCQVRKGIARKKSVRECCKICVILPAAYTVHTIHIDTT